MVYTEYFTCDPVICGGDTAFHGIRVMYRTVLASLAEGATIEEIITNLPTLTQARVRTAVASAAASAEEDLPVSGVPHVA